MASPMLCLISPAKTLDYESALPDLVPTTPRFPAETERLAKGAKGLSAKKLKELMHISDALATLNAGRYRNFAEQPERPALFAFAGDVYTGFEAQSLDAPALDFAQDHVRILSGLYGLLRPMDLIRPYRLEMGTRWAPRHDSLYSFWGKKIAKLIESDLDEQDDHVVINAASQEYAKAALPQLSPKVRVIDIDFREIGPSGERFNSFAAKRARGMIARYISEHRIDRADAVKGFDSDGYRYDAEGSDENRWRFIRR